MSRNSVIAQIKRVFSSPDFKNLPIEEKKSTFKTISISQLAASVNLSKVDIAVIYAESIDISSIDSVYLIPLLLISPLQMNDVVMRSPKIQSAYNRDKQRLWEEKFKSDFEGRYYDSSTNELLHKDAKAAYDHMSKPAAIYKIKARRIDPYSYGPGEAGEIIENFLERMTPSIRNLIFYGKINPREGDIIYFPDSAIMGIWHNGNTLLKPVDEAEDESGHAPPEISFPNFPLDHYREVSRYIDDAMSLSKSAEDEAIRTFDPASQTFTVSDNYNTFKVKVTTFRAEQPSREDFQRAVKSYNTPVFSDGKEGWFIHI